MNQRFLFITLFIFFSITPLLTQERGYASYYHPKLHGRPTASGLIYHKDSMTCAHRNYPFGTLLLIENEQNNKKIIVKVTDRGPFSRKFIIDLSYQAAKQIGILKQGYAKVKITPHRELPHLYELLEPPFPLKFNNKPTIKAPLFPSPNKEEK